MVRFAARSRSERAALPWTTTSVRCSRAFAGASLVATTGVWHSSRLTQDRLISSSFEISRVPLPCSRSRSTSCHNEFKVQRHSGQAVRGVGASVFPCAVGGGYASSPKLWVGLATRQVRYVAPTQAKPPEPRPLHHGDAPALGQPSAGSIFGKGTQSWIDPAHTPHGYIPP